MIGPKSNKAAVASMSIGSNLTLISLESFGSNLTLISLDSFGSANNEGVLILASTAAIVEARVSSSTFERPVLQLKPPSLEEAVIIGASLPASSSLNIDSKVCS
ncbi:unnamed protein product [[Candida] boidinii]|nr:unnamed protein product [[Candida] boidinii]